MAAAHVVLVAAWLCAWPLGGVGAVSATGPASTIAAPIQTQEPDTYEQRCAGYCSKDKVGYWMGPLDAHSDLLQAVTALTYKHELIITHDGRPDHVAFAINRWRSFGYWHMLTVTNAEATCRTVARVMSPAPGCGWYSEELGTRLPWAAGNGGLWWKFLTALRAARSGLCNVLVVDSDVRPLWRFYEALAGSALRRRVGLWAMQEHYAVRDVNNGVLYLRNVSAAGPALHTLYAAMATAVRLYENTSVLAARFPSVPLPPAGWSLWDQAAITDAVWGAVAGRPLFMAAYGPFIGPSREAKEAWDMTHINLLTSSGPAGQSRSGPYLGATEWFDRAPDELRAGNGGRSTYRLAAAELRLPCTRGGWPQELGGCPFGAGRGPQSALLDELVFGDGLPRWPDPEDASLQAEAAAAATPPELFAWFPSWLLNSRHAGGFNRGAGGFWMSHLATNASAAAAALAHMHAGLLAGDCHTKLVHMMLEWGEARQDLDLAARLNSLGAAAGGDGSPGGASDGAGGSGTAAAGAAQGSGTAAAGGARRSGGSEAGGGGGRSDVEAGGGGGGARGVVEAAYFSTAARRVLPPLVAYLPPGVSWNAVGGGAAASNGSGAASGGGGGHVLHAGLSQKEFAELLQALLHVALALGRIVAWPWLPCEVGWVRRAHPMTDPTGRVRDPVTEGHAIPWDEYLDEQAVIPHGMAIRDAAELARPGTSLPCFTRLLNRRECVIGGLAPGPRAPDPSAPRGIFPFELDHWLEHSERDRPGPHNTIDPWVSPTRVEDPEQSRMRMQGRAAAAAGSGGGTGAQQRPPSQLSAADIAGIKERFRGQRVVWLSGRMDVGEVELGEALAGVAARVKEGCCALQEAPHEGCLIRPPMPAPSSPAAAAAAGH